MHWLSVTQFLEYQCEIIIVYGKPWLIDKRGIYSWVSDWWVNNERLISILYFRRWWSSPQKNYFVVSILQIFLWKHHLEQSTNLTWLKVTSSVFSYSQHQLYPCHNTTLLPDRNRSRQRKRQINYVFHNMLLVSNYLLYIWRAWSCFEYRIWWIYNNNSIIMFLSSQNELVYWNLWCIVYFAAILLSRNKTEFSAVNLLLPILLINVCCYQVVCQSPVYCRSIVNGCHQFT